MPVKRTSDSKRIGSLSRKKTKILLTGGSGFIGTNAVEYFLKEGYQVLNADIKPPKKQEHLKYYQECDLRDSSAVLSMMKKFRPDFLLHLGARTGMDVADASEFNANTIGVSNLIEAGNRTPSLKAAVFTSSLLVCKNGYIPRHDRDYCPPNLYGKSKAEGEEIVRNSKIRFSWAIIRPTAIWGPWFEESYLQFFRAINSGYYFHIGRTEIIKPTCFVGNAVFLMEKILRAGKSEMHGKTFYLADYPPYSTRTWADTIAAELGGRKILSMPLVLLRIAGAAGTALKKITGREMPLTLFRLGNMLTGGEYPLSNTQEICAKLPLDLRESVHLTADWMRSEGLIRN